MPRNKAVWEAPDDGSGSDYDDEDEEKDLDFESDWEEEEEGERISFNGDKPAATTTEQYEEDLRKGFRISV